eukprot:1147892-Pelagomonas_calceolata.AAC.2
MEWVRPGPRGMEQVLHLPTTVPENTYFSAHQPMDTGKRSTAHLVPLALPKHEPSLADGHVGACGAGRLQPQERGAVERKEGSCKRGAKRLRQ